MSKATKKHSKSTKAAPAAGNSTNHRNGMVVDRENPFLEDSTPSANIDTIHGALVWLQNADLVIEQAFAGTPNDKIKHGRFILGECCYRALQVIAQELDDERASAKEGGAA